MDDLPGELLASYGTLSNQLSVDAPTGDVDLEAESVTPRLWLERRPQDKAIGRGRLTTVAIERTGDVVAYTDLILAPGPSTANAGTNNHMVDINVRLGFEAIEVCPMLGLRLHDAVAPPAGAIRSAPRPPDRQRRRGR